MILSAALLQLMFSYSVQKDPFTDAETHLAWMGYPKGVYMAVECGAGTDRRMIVRIRGGRALYSAGFQGLAQYSDRFRFGEQPQMTLKVRYINDDAILTGRDAATFVENLVSTDRFVVELTDYRAQPLVLQFRTKWARDSVEQVEEGCRAIEK